MAKDASMMGGREVPSLIVVAAATDLKVSMKGWHALKGELESAIAMSMSTKMRSESFANGGVQPLFGLDLLMPQSKNCREPLGPAVSVVLAVAPVAPHFESVMEITPPADPPPPEPEPDEVPFVAEDAALVVVVVLLPLPVAVAVVVELEAFATQRCFLVEVRFWNMLSRTA